MSQKDKFTGFDFRHNPYEEEARRLWGDEAVEQSNQHIASLSSDEQQAIAKGMDDLFTELAAVRNQPPDSKAAQKSIDKMYSHFNSKFGHHYSLDAFANLGQMYVADERFTANIDKYGDGLSAFLAEAMAVYADNCKK